MKYTISYERRVQTGRYESTKIGLSKEYEEYNFPMHAAYVEVRDLVDRWCSEVPRDDVS